MGFKIRDLALNEFNRNPEWEQKREKTEEYERMGRCWPLCEMLSVIEPKNRKHWRKMAENYFERWYWLRCDLEPEWKRQREHECEVQHIISEYGFDELWSCLPYD
jgi:hypothetical protein